MKNLLPYIEEKYATFDSKESHRSQKFCLKIMSRKDTIMGEREQHFSMDIFLLYISNLQNSNNWKGIGKLLKYKFYDKYSKQF